MVDACRGLTFLEIENALAYSLYTDHSITPESIIREKQEVIKSSRSLEYFQPKEGMDTVGGLEILKEWLDSRRKAFSQKARTYGLPYPKGILVVGLPGTGKSLISKAVANQWKFPLIRFDIGSAFQKYLGESEAEVRNARMTAEAVSPCVFWIDEIDKALKMQGDADSAGGVGTRILGDLLTWMQEKSEPVVVVATCNDVMGLSSALLRKGRFDEIFFADLPGPTALKAILDIHLIKRGRDPEALSTESLVGSAVGLVGAEIEAAIEDSLFSAYGEGREVTTNDIHEALGRVIPYSVMQYTEADALRKWAKTNARPASAETVDLREVLESRKSSGKTSRRASRISMVEKAAEKPQ